MEVIIEVLDKAIHARNSFNCEVIELNNFLKKHASQNQLLNISKTYVAVLKNDLEKLKRIGGYYTLSTGEVSFSGCVYIKDNLPKYPIPIVRIGRLAVDKDYKGQGLGGFLLHDALTRILNVSQEIGVYAVVVDAKENVKEFYINYGFIPLKDDGLTLFLPIQTILSGQSV